MHEIRLINHGGFGVVHEVEVDDGKRIARKCFDPQIGTLEDRHKLLKRFEREVRIQSTITHPNIMPILLHDLSAIPPWFTMPLATQSFQTKIADDLRASKFDPSPWQDILAAVEELHRLGFVHRDLKPANILQVEKTWVISDFGLILPTARETTVLTNVGSAYGSHYYAAPEQATDFRNATQQTDIFALGCILHDMVDPTGGRVPYAQIRIGGPYGPILEKCTEKDPGRRFPTIAALRAALFDLFSASVFAAPTPNDAQILQSVLDTPDGEMEWRALIGHVETLDPMQRDPILRAINSQLISKLFNVDGVLFSRMVGHLCSWAAGTGFEWAYCDVIGDRLLDAYRIATVQTQCEVVLSALELAVSHNRWHVMGQVGSMLGPTADNGLIDRILIEMAMDWRIEWKLLKIEEVISWARNNWHEKIANYLTTRENARKAN